MANRGHTVWDTLWLIEDIYFISLRYARKSRRYTFWDR